MQNEKHMLTKLISKAKSSGVKTDIEKIEKTLEKSRNFRHFEIFLLLPFSRQLTHLAEGG